ncbi:aromatic acid decarboxylase [Alcanivorax jadensis T9]|jgi:4-hydroxy-3-polyprenylbenzoate decarboxylase|uniref:Flavin prenyltransferase UbiX n=1 Tax=Alcanivorax jadensis T9 TaxID=1177181 RepID=A0ABR4W9G8_9GAMM|nr:MULTISPECIES: flavin prenyltransferase UbiX [Alcanivorax]KGD59902.1 aromatic acid decarboxylase [Alcanivorax jadensis T9]MBG32420.1 aromatic acid decarboxylase [Alcanivorax sp.]MBP23367.1 aromatic acid decarboxylase [Alcanivorax sp.]MDF1638949.1 UbiX family flavin prenyltransferase [Alcanivorax jadensis]|tara:strand:- start:3389 stop:3991 length:603 start_codon:yes stop_codon:yes gene_type:complete
MSKRITLAFTGASGAPYGLRLLQCLLQADCEVFVILSKAARVVIGMETELKLPAGTGKAEQALRDWVQTDRGTLVVCGLEQWTSPVASGSGAPAAMVVCPCSTGTLSSIACGASDNLIERAADVAIKEGRKLILVPREAPFSPLHLENMLKLSRLGVTIMPAAPGFYHQPQTVGDLVDFIVARLLDHLGVEQTLVKRWGE